MPDVNPDLAWAVEDVRKRLPAYAQARNYHQGVHRLTFATEKFRNAFGDLFREFADNLCDDVVDEPVDRLQIVNWSGRRAADAQEAWIANKGDARSGEVHLNGYREGDGFLLVWTDPEGISRMYPKDPATMAVAYEPEMPDRVRVAAQVWREGKRYRATLYYADRIERYATKGTSPDGGLPKANAFQPLVETEAVLDDTTGEATEIVTQDWLEPHDWGKVPVFHFPNETVGKYGRSVLADVYPLQDALNKSISDMLVAMEFHALPQRWGTGVQVEYDDQGREKDPFTTGAERFWRVGSKDATLGQFDPADLSQFLDVQDGFRLEIARKGALPPHSVNLRNAGNLPSGVALLVSEGKQIKRVRNCQRDWGDTWREAMAMLITMANPSSPCTPADLDIEWAPPETRDEKALIETLLMKKELKVSDRQLLIEAGYTEAEADEFLDEAEAAAAQAADQFDVASGGRTSPLGMGDSGALAGALGLPQAPTGPPGGPQSPLGG